MQVFNKYITFLGPGEFWGDSMAAGIVILKMASGFWKTLSNCWKSRMGMLGRTFLVKYGIMSLIVRCHTSSQSLQRIFFFYVETTYNKFARISPEAVRVIVHLSSSIVFRP